MDPRTCSSGTFDELRHQPLGCVGRGGRRAARRSSVQLPEGFHGDPDGSAVAVGWHIACARVTEGADFGGNRGATRRRQGRDRLPEDQARRARARARASRAGVTERRARDGEFVASAAQIFIQRSPRVPPPTRAASASTSASRLGRTSARPRTRRRASSSRSPRASSTVAVQGRAIKRGRGRSPRAGSPRRRASSCRSPWWSGTVRMLGRRASSSAGARTRRAAAAHLRGRAVQAASRSRLSAQHARGVEYETPRLRCWGEDTNGQAPAASAARRDYAQVSVGGTTTCAPIVAATRRRVPRPPHRPAAADDAALARRACAQRAQAAAPPGPARRLGGQPEGAAAARGARGAARRGQRAARRRALGADRRRLPPPVRGDRGRRAELRGAVDRLRIPSPSLASNARLRGREAPARPPRLARRAGRPPPRPAGFCGSHAMLVRTLRPLGVVWWRGGGGGGGSGGGGQGGGGVAKRPRSWPSCSPRGGGFG